MLSFDIKLFLVSMLIIVSLILILRYCDKLNLPIMRDNEIPVEKVKFQTENIFEKYEK